MDKKPNRIAELREEKGWSMEALAEAVQPPTTASQINKLEKGQRKLSEKWRKRLSAALNVDESELLYDVPDKDKKASAARKNQNFPQGLPEYGGLTPQPTDEIPVYGFAAGSGRMTAQINDENIVETRQRHPAQAGVKGAFWVYVIGDSMAPKYEHGEMVAIHPGRLPQKGDDCLFTDAEGNAHIKRFVSIDTKGIRVKQFNPPEELTFEVGEYSRLCTVVGMMK